MNTSTNLSPLRRAKVKAKVAVIQLPEVAELLDSFWDGRMVFVIEKVKGKMTIVTLEIHEDDLVSDLIQPA